MEIEFFLKAVPWRKKHPVTRQVESGLSIREFFEAKSVSKKKNIKGEMVPVIHIEGAVDEDVQVQNSKQYKNFASLIEAQKDKLYEAAKAAPGEKIYPVME